MKSRWQQFKFDRVYHPIDQWEEVAHNMWGDSADGKADFEFALGFTGDHLEYGRFMLRVVNEWPISCENALTDSSLNKRAWVGHAAVALARGVPEDITRNAWGFLHEQQRILANEAADRAIYAWSLNYAQSKGILPDVGEPLL